MREVRTGCPSDLWAVGSFTETLHIQDHLTKQLQSQTEVVTDLSEPLRSPVISGKPHRLIFPSPICRTVRTFDYDGHVTSTF